MVQGSFFVNPYVPLWCKSHYSFLEGASHPEELVDRAQSLGIEALALTDREGVYGIARAHVRAREAGVRLITGAEVHLERGDRVALLAMDREGYGNLCQLITRGRRRVPKGQCELTSADVCDFADGLIALATRPGSIESLVEAFDDRLYAAVARHRHEQDVEREAELRLAADRFAVPTVAVTRCSTTPRRGARCRTS